MPRPSKRTRSKRRVSRTVPGGARGTSYRGKIFPVPRCSACGRPLTGISNMSPIKARKLNRGKRRIWRPHGGQLCHNCLKIALRQAVRAF